MRSLRQTPLGRIKHCVPESSDQFEPQTRVPGQPLDKPVAENGRRCPEAAGGRGLGRVEREAGAGLAEHLAGRAVAGIAIAGDLDLQRMALRRAAEDADVEEAVALLLGRSDLRRAPAGNARAPSGSAARPAAAMKAPSPAPMLVAAARPLKPSPREHGLVVAEVSAIRLLRQGVRAMDDAGVDRRHHERCDPRLEVGVVLRERDVGLPKLRRVAVRAQRIRVRELPA